MFQATLKTTGPLNQTQEAEVKASVAQITGVPESELDFEFKTLANGTTEVIITPREGASMQSATEKLERSRSNATKWEEAGFNGSPQAAAVSDDAPAGTTDDDKKKYYIIAAAVAGVVLVSVVAFMVHRRLRANNSAAYYEPEGVLQDPTSARLNADADFEMSYRRERGSSSV